MTWLASLQARASAQNNARLAISLGTLLRLAGALAALLYSPVLSYVLPESVIGENNQHAILKARAIRTLLVSLSHYRRKLLLEVDLPRILMRPIPAEYYGRSQHQEGGLTSSRLETKQ